MNLSILKPARNRLLHKAIWANAIFSNISGLFILLAARPIATFLAVPLVWPLLIIGISLICYSLFLFKTTKALTISKGIAWFIIVGDLSWIIATIVLLILDPWEFSYAGKWAIAIIADIVALFAIAQYSGLRKEQAQ